MIRKVLHILWFVSLLASQGWVKAQCVNYSVDVSAGGWPAEVSWSIVNSANVIVASGFAPANVVVCLPAGCYTINMYDSFGDGWNGSVLTITDPSLTQITAVTFTAGFSSTFPLALGGANCCPAGTLPYTIDVTSGLFPLEVSWDLVNSGGFIVASGGAGSSQSLCLEPDCYTMYMYDAFADGWDGAQFTITGGAVVIATGTLNTGDFGIMDFAVGGASCAPLCPVGEESYNIVVSGDLFPSEVSWVIYDDTGFPFLNGGAGESNYFCAHPGCYEIEMFDAFGDGWQGASYTIYDDNGLPVQSGMLEFGYLETNVIEMGGADCGVVNPITASDCITAVNVCENLNFQIDPNGSGLINEIPPPGSTSNPEYYIDGTNSPWGTDHDGCLLGGELNSTWMILNIWQGGLLNFTFGGMGTQAGFYDWIMFPYDPDNTCQDIYNNVLPPVRCNWNFSSTGGTGLASVIPAGGNANNYEPPLNVLTGEQYLICFSNWSSATTTVPLDFGGTAIVGCSELIMPVSMSHFSVMQQGQQALLHWTTVSERDNDRFEVEHSIDGKNWKVCGTREGMGNSDQMVEYHFLHETPVQGLNYYRLHQFDYNGLSKLSQTEVLVFSEEELVIYPNPNNGTFMISSSQNLDISDMTGRPCSYTISTVTSGYAEVKLNDIVPGVYVITEATTSKRQRIVVR